MPSSGTGRDHRITDGQLRRDVTGIALRRNEPRGARVGIGGRYEIVAFGAIGFGRTGNRGPSATVVGETN